MALAKVRRALDSVHASRTAAEQWLDRKLQQGWTPLRISRECAGVYVASVVRIKHCRRAGR